MNRRNAGLGFALLIALLLAGCSGREATSVDPASSVAPASIEAQPTIAAREMEATSTPVPADLVLHIDAFGEGGAIPDRYTCVGANDSPAVSWSGVPTAAQALVLIVFDGDAGADLGAGNDLGFLHWMVYDLPPTAEGLPLGATGDERLLAGGIETANDFAEAAGGRFPGGAGIRGTGYDGPCPPAQHTYVFRLLALRESLDLAAGTPYPSVLSALEGRVLAVADFRGVYPPAP
jgi:Raf kinase inhibitor-like YbhB/YbcL family protein